MKNLSIILFFLNISVWGQEFSITGNVIDSDTQKPLEYATIVLKSLSNGSITGGITDEKGHFKIKASKGIYQIKIHFFSYEDYQIENFNLNSDKNIGTVSLRINISELDEVQVISQRSSVEMHLDRKIYNVGTDMTIKGGSVSDVLDNVPSVTVDSEGKVSLRGNENVRILINGKPSALSGVDDEALRQLPAETIERVEVISNPSSRYEAEGTAGIINIILKKGSTQGFIGSATTSIGYPENYGGAFNINWHKKNWTFFNNTSYQYRNSPGKNTINQQNFDNTGNTANFQDEFRNINRLRKGINFNLGAEYRFGNNTSVTNSIVLDNRRGFNETDTYFYNFDANKLLISERYRRNYETDNDSRFQYSFNFEHRFHKKGHKITADYQYSTSEEKEDAIIRERIISTNTNVDTEQTISDESEKKHLIQLDYVLPFGENEKTQLEIGYRGAFDQTEIDFTMGTLDLLGNLIINNHFSNEFVFNQNIHAFYTQYGTKIGKWNFMGGIRMEHTNITSLLKTNNENYSKKYTNFFPSLYLGYEFDQSKQISVSYSRRLHRPRSRFINPFVSRTSNTNLFSGNPNIDPTYTNVYEIAFLKRWEQFSINTSAYYNHSTQVFEFISIETGDFVNINNPSSPSSILSVPVMLRTPINLSNEQRTGIELTTTYTPWQNWRFMWNLNIFHLTTDGTYSYTNYIGTTISQNFNAKSTTWFTRLSTKIPLPFKIDLQTNITYEGPRKTAQSNRKGIFATNLAISKEILKGKGNISFNVNDLFNSRIMKNDTWTNTVFAHNEMQWRRRQMMLNFTYRFGNTSEKQTNKKRLQNLGSEGENMDFEG